MIDVTVLLGLVIVLSLTFYALLGGADYGGASGTSSPLAPPRNVSAPPLRTRSAPCGRQIMCGSSLR